MKLCPALSLSLAVMTVFGAASARPALADPTLTVSPSNAPKKATVTRPYGPRPPVRVAALRRPIPAANKRICVEAPRPIPAPPPMVRAVAPAETGAAAWYGGKYLGRRTTSGQVLDSVTPTAAHRTLPLNTLVRVTNLGNGRSVVAKVNDRGPVSPSLLIDMSPKAAEQLDMKTAGIARVMVEQVVAVPPDAK